MFLISAQLRINPHERSQNTPYRRSHSGIPSVPSQGKILNVLRGDRSLGNKLLGISINIYSVGRLHCTPDGRLRSTPYERSRSTPYERSHVVLIYFQYCSTGKKCNLLQGINSLIRER
ncbi:hypothetical protein [Cylindrospermopsis raciborskii]|uniref:hypothetical protein n=1 Tax=Cylindrospermopsis raciborskii TaxID=77022 RepID=UPI001F2B3D62|nr:hypothetical protein [Cylindrospermopsis raciborskii]UJS06234.1 hypothetical protein L3I90_08515 [Cylindrospermopsis raciborskii KLL07]